VASALSAAYTAYGGLAVSIVTDQAQGALCLVLIGVVALHVLSTFSRPLPADLGENSRRGAPAGARARARGGLRARARVGGVQGRWGRSCRQETRSGRRRWW